MNSVFLNNLTDSEFLKQVQPQTDLERMLVERLEHVDADAGEVESALERAHEAEEAQERAEDRIDDLGSELERLREYANKLHAALSEKDPDNELIDHKDAQWLHP